MSFKVEGLVGLEKALMELAETYGPKEAIKSIRPALKKAAGPIEDTIRLTTPKDKGTLAASTATKISKVTGKLLRSAYYHSDMVLVARIGWHWSGKSLWNQALAIEFGTSEMSGSPTLRQAFDTTTDQAVIDFREELGPAIEKKAAQLYRKYKGI